MTTNSATQSGTYRATNILLYAARGGMAAPCVATWRHAGGLARSEPLRADVAARAVNDPAVDDPAVSVIVASSAPLAATPPESRT